MSPAANANSYRRRRVIDPATPGPISKNGYPIPTRKNCTGPYSAQLWRFDLQQPQQHARRLLYGHTEAYFDLPDAIAYSATEVQRARRALDAALAAIHLLGIDTNAPVSHYKADTELPLKHAHGKATDLRYAMTHHNALKRLAKQYPHLMTKTLP